MHHRTNQTLRPTLVDYDMDMNEPVFEVAANTDPCIIFLEIADPKIPGMFVPRYVYISLNNQKPILIKTKII